MAALECDGLFFLGQSFLEARWHYSVARNAAKSRCRDLAKALMAHAVPRSSEEPRLESRHH
eukprot:700223-Rhodomonas_salina.3